MNYPWLRKIPWYHKITRIAHCFFSLMAPIVYMDYLIDDLEYLRKALEA